MPESKVLWDILACQVLVCRVTGEVSEPGLTLRQDRLTISMFSGMGSIWHVFVGWQPGEF